MAYPDARGNFPGSARISSDCRTQSRHRKPPQAATERAKPQAATKIVSQADKNVNRKTRQPAQLKAFSFQNYQYLATKMVRLSCSFRDGQDLPCRQSKQCARGNHA